jgi:hypothetical protein
MEPATDTMWDAGAGVTAFSLESAEQLWHVDYADAAFGADTSARPTDATSEVVSNGEGKIAVLYSSVSCPDDECEEEMNYVIGTIDLANGTVLGSVSGVGPLPRILAFVGDVVVYSPSWESITAVKADNPDGDPVWTSPTFDVYEDAIINDAIFTAMPEDVEDALGWVNIADGSPAPYTLNLIDYDAFSLASPEEAIVTRSDETTGDHVVESVNPVTNEPLWEATIAMTEEEVETVQLAANRVILTYESDVAFRTIALSREDGAQAWSIDDAGAGQVTDKWALIDSSGTTLEWPVVNIEDGSQVASVNAGDDSIPSVQLSEYAMLLSYADVLEARPLTGPDAGTDAPLWSTPTDFTYAEITSRLGDLLLLDPLTGSSRKVTPS